MSFVPSIVAYIDRITLAFGLYCMRGDRALNRQGACFLLIGDDGNEHCDVYQCILWLHGIL